MQFLRKMEDINKNSGNVKNLLIVVSFIMSLFAFILIIVDAKNFSTESIKSKKPILVSNEKAGIENKLIQEKEQKIEKNEQKIINETEVKIEKEIQQEDKSIKNKKDIENIESIIEDLEKIQEVKKIDNKEKNEQLKSNIQSKSTIRFKSFNIKEDALLELNKIRLKHKDIFSKLDSQVKEERGSDNAKIYTVIGFVKTKNDADNLCKKFELRNVKCSVK